MDNSIDQLRWNVRRRLEFIEFRLIWDGRFNRKDVMEAFNISAQQASLDIGRYEQIGPRNLVYDPAKKVYVRTEQFKPVLVADNIDRYLFQLIAIEHKWIRIEESWFNELPSVDVVSLPRGLTDPVVLLRVRQAIRDRLAIDIDYTSLSGKSEPSRTIAPHALVHNNEHWYVRSWSGNSNDFRNYHLDRISNISNVRPSTIDSSLDYEWVHEIDLVIVPNPSLPKQKRDAIARGFGMKDGRMLHRCRISSSFLLMSQHNLDVNPNTLDPKKQQIILQNRDEVERARDVMRKMSRDALTRVQLQEIDT